MAGFGDFAQALQFGAGLVHGFQKQTEELKKTHENQQLELLKLLSHDQTKSIEPVQADDIVDNSGIFGKGSLTTKEGHPVFRVGGNAFSVKPRPAIGVGDEGDIGVPAPSTATPANAPGAATQPQPSKDLFGPPPTAPAAPAPSQGPATSPGLSTAVEGSTSRFAASKQRQPEVHDKIVTTVQQVAAKRGVSAADLLGLIQLESDFKPNAEGPMTRYGWRAQGLGQLSPDTGKRFGVTDPFDIAQNIDGTAQAWQEALKRAGGDKRVAYNKYYNPGASDKDTNIFLSAQQQFAQMPATSPRVVQAQANQAKPPTAASTPEQDAAYRQANVQQPGAGGGVPGAAAPRAASPLVTAAGQPADTSMMVAGAGAPGPQQTASEIPPAESVEQRQAAASLRIRKQYANAVTKDELKERRTKLEEERNRVDIHYNQEVKEVQTELEKLLKKTHDPELRDLIESGDIKTHVQFDALKKKIKNTTERDYFEDATNYMKAAVKAGSGDDAAVKVFQQLKRAGYSRDEITDVLSVSGYTDKNKQIQAGKLAKQQKDIDIAAIPEKQAAELPGQVQLEKEKGKVAVATAKAQQEALAPGKQAEKEAEAGIVKPTADELPYVNKKMAEHAKLDPSVKDLSMSEYLKKFPHVLEDAQVEGGKRKEAGVAAGAEARETAKDTARAERVQKATDELSALEQPQAGLSPDEKHKAQLNILTKHGLKPEQLDTELANHIKESAPFKSAAERTSWVTPDYHTPNVGSVADSKTKGAVQMSREEVGIFKNGNLLHSTLQRIQETMDTLASFDPAFAKLQEVKGPWGRAQQAFYKETTAKLQNNPKAASFVDQLDTDIREVAQRYGRFVTGMTGRPSQKLIEQATKKMPTLTDVPEKMLTQLNLMKDIVRTVQDDQLQSVGAITPEDQRIRRAERMQDILHPERAKTPTAKTTTQTAPAAQVAPVPSKGQQEADAYLSGGTK